MNRFESRGECTSSCNAAFTKHMFPAFTNPRARKRGIVTLPVGRKGVVLLRSAALRKDGKWDGEVAEMENSTTDSDKVGCKGLEPVEVFASPEVDGLFRMAGVDVGTGAGVGVGAGVDGVDKIKDKIPSMSSSPNAAIISCCVVPSEGWHSVVAGGMLCGAAAITLDGNTSMGRELV